MLLERLVTQFLGYAKRLDRTEALDTLTPIRVFGLTHRAPISRSEFTNPSHNHEWIVACRRAGPQ